MQKIAEQETVKNELVKSAEEINKFLHEVMSEQSEIERKLKEAMEYALYGEGKRARAAVIMWVCKMICGEVNNDAKTAAAAMEMVHTYSLVHDDLPAMDDDDLRRGRPTVHKKYDEATAILTGDALLTLAFELLATDVCDSNKAIKMVGILSCVAGPSGMVAGQMADMLSEQTEPDIEMVNYIHNNKTAMMFSGAAALGAIAAGASSDVISKMTIYGLKIGLGFQVADDILDITATTEQMGKTVGKDLEQGKATYPAILGMEKSKEAAEKLANEALELLKDFGDKAQLLRGLIFMLLHRTK
ncbi:MAG: polyprenyl synthetase family protein [Sedimentisphaeraceae bacterium JB056]